ncbi:AAA family ATPase [Allosalinactinospora lopnorensis]|uniref:AAA family ATPase n=1 Tax=Allosalinactinospora lopnorensis TaxID=1352348 RepID=UPI000695ADCB|nr:AAA family ATPase [Allosalinactinospora lopnorensis]
MPHHGHDAHPSPNGLGAHASLSDATAAAERLLSQLNAAEQITTALPSNGEGTGEEAPHLETYTAADLMSMDFPEPVWAVPGLVCEGVNLLAGAPKVGKSWLSLGLGIAVASGGKALGSIDVSPGPVLYLALEDTARRLQSRLSRVLAGTPAPEQLAFATQAPPLPQGGDDYIAAWLDRRPGARMVIIDVFAKLRGSPPAGLSAYEADYRAVSAVKRLADTYQVAVVLVHHTRKTGGGGGDFLEEVSGTNGLAGAADATLVLKRSRGKADAELCVTGRDVDESEYAMEFVADIGAWHLLDGPAQEYTVTDTQAAILRYLREHDDGRTPKRISTDLELAAGTVKSALNRLSSERGLLTTDGNGRYFAAATSSESTPESAFEALPIIADP